MTKLMEKIKNFKMFLGAEVWNLFVLATGLGFLWFLVESGFVIVLQSFLMSIGLIDKSKTLLPHWFPIEIWATTLILIGFGVCRGVVVAMRYYFAVATGQAFVSHQKSQILEISLHNASNMSTSEVITTYSEHTNTASIALQQIAQLINNFVSIILFVGAGFYLAPKEFLLSLSLLGVVVVPFILLNKSIHGIGVIINTEKEYSTKVLIDGLKNNFFLQIYHLVSFEVKKGSESLKRYEKAYKKYGRVAGARTAIPQTIGAVVVAVVTFISLKYFHTPGSKLLSFFYIFIRMAQCVSDFYSVSGDIKIQMIGLKTLYSWNEKLSIMKGLDNFKQLNVSSNELANITIDVSHVNFLYAQKTILNDMSFNLGPGEILLIRGESGAGKSTLLSLIVGLNKPTSGEIKINNLPPHLIRTNLSEKIGYVGPEPFLVAGSVKENLLYGHPYPKNVSEDQLWLSLEKAQLKKEIENLENKLDENLLEKTQFSTGQKQRLSIARALIRNPSILILDEATANLDPETEAKFIEILSSVSFLMTTIIVSHKDSFNNLATKQITLQKVI